MIGMAPYLYFSGRCEEALAFYADVFDGHIKAKIRFGEAIPNTDKAHESWVLHAEFEAKGMNLMMSDGMPHTPKSPPTNQIGMAVAVEDTAEQDRLFAKLVEGGEVIQKLENTFYGGRLGMLRDRFGIMWMLNWSPARQ